MELSSEIQTKIEEAQQLELSKSDIETLKYVREMERDEKVKELLKQLFEYA
jgi:hypothetical protein